VVEEETHRPRARRGGGGATGFRNNQQMCFFLRHRINKMLTQGNKLDRDVKNSSIRAPGVDRSTVGVSITHDQVGSTLDLPSPSPAVRLSSSIFTILIIASLDC
jgi:hypothetical protein